MWYVPNILNILTLGISQHLKKNLVIQKKTLGEKKQNAFPSYEIFDFESVP